MNPEDENLIRSYRVTFRSPAGLDVLYNLMKFSRFKVELVSADAPDATRLMIYEGRRQVICRIIQMANLSDDEILATFGRRLQPSAQTEDVYG
jgi:hypothetical protein